MSTLKGFKEFVMRGNAVDLAVGVVIGAAFSGVVNSLVKDLLTPLIGAIAKTPDFSRWSFSIRGSQFMYGEFINNLISFVLVASAVYFFVIVPMHRLFPKKEAVSTTKTCDQCKSSIPQDAVRCAFCTQPVVEKS